MNNVQDLFITILVPQNIMSLCCAYTGKPKSTWAPSKDSQNKGRTYKLSETDPERLQRIIDFVLQSPDSNIVVDTTSSKTRTKNVEFLKRLNKFNEEVREYKKDHPDDDFTQELTPQDLVKHIDMRHYHNTFMDDNGVEYHSFNKLFVPQLVTDDNIYVKKFNKDTGKEELTKITLRLYVKFKIIGDKIDVTSLHTGLEE